MEALILWFLLTVKPAEKRGEKNPSKNSDLSYRTEPVSFKSNSEDSSKFF